ncbi:MAG: GNAT family N-acetyltransferase [Anaerolineae bacterium]|nr:GNAT family N-acetyltransferase [Anaerolineae bacterium]
MAVEFRAITPENFIECIKLKVHEDQISFVASNVFSIAQAYVHPQCHVRAIYAGDTMVGFVMWGMDPEQPTPEMWVWRMMIGADYQRKGYGRAAMEQLIALLKTEGLPALFLSYEPENTGGAAFYQTLGFEDTGRVEHGEKVVQLNLG